MIVYANHLSFSGPDAEEAIFRALGGWLKSQIGFGLHPNQITKPGDHVGTKGDMKSWLHVDATLEDEPKLCSWVLKHPDDSVRGRQWITELGLKSQDGQLDLSCVVKVDELSTLVDDPVSASRPRVIGYVIQNIQDAKDADFIASVPGLRVKTVGGDEDSYRGLLADIEHLERDYPIVLVSPTPEGVFLLNIDHLQQQLIGLAQVVQVVPGFNSYDLEEILGRAWSAWGGAVNLLHTPRRGRGVYGKLFLSGEIKSWGESQRERTSHILAWVTNNTNVPRLRMRIRPDGVRQLALRRRLQASRSKAANMDADQLRSELESVWGLAEEQETQVKALQENVEALEMEVMTLNEARAEDGDKFRAKQFELKNVKEQLDRAGGGKITTFEVDSLIDMICRSDQPSPEECLKVIEEFRPSECVVLDSAIKSAQTASHFSQGRRLLSLLVRLTAEYRAKMIEGGDNLARDVFSPAEYAATESESVISNPALRRKRTFSYQGHTVEMLRHLKIGITDDAMKTIRVHFHWDSDRKLIVIGYCGAHLPISK